ncbi:fungal-specific transcription factor domain-containing protein [Limtongia smithiae]|uniref:fungal-specific transcription factor domain-containing protein n=1 Tax=Limtongia smithiae TaxID=1125753 RepID=UPI0034CF7DB7
MDSGSRPHDAKGFQYGGSGGEDSPLPRDDESGNSKARRRRRSRKGLDKVFGCDAPGCGKKFTRSEHLARHKLNHAPKQIFSCGWPDCTKSFVREDLKIRHMERHKRKVDGPPAEYEDMKLGVGMFSQESIAPARLLQQQLPPAATPPPPLPAAGLAHEMDLSTVLATPGQEEIRFLPMSVAPPPPPLLSPQLDAVAATQQHFAVPMQSPPQPPAVAESSPVNVNMSPHTANNTADLINWLFSDGMLSNSRELFLPPNFYSSFESPMDLPNLLTPPTPPRARMMSEMKRLDLLGLIPSLENHEDFDMECIHRYISLYWDKFHFQFPILHRPSFEADTTPGPLLWSIILIGAHYGSATDLARKISEPLRWVIFGSPGFHPPAKIWIIQSLLLLETYEKMMGTRKMHERGHIHHGTTLQLIRRGTTLLGTSTNSGALRATSGTSEIWKRWIEAEMAKRAVFMAFTLDVCHAALFAHSLVMSAHEIRLSLPCNEDAWELMPEDRSHVVRTPTMPFLKALKKVLNQQSVATGRYGSVVLLCGLMSLSYQMEQLDLQVSALGWGAFRDTWRTTLAPALDFWKADYDRRFPRVDMAIAAGPMDSTYLQRAIPPMWHMAHVSMRVSIYDLQVFCGVHKVLGRPTMRQDFQASQRRIRDWAISERAPDAAFHAVQSIYEVFVVGDVGMYYGNESYSAGHDWFVHRAGIVSHCAQVIWAYGFCLEGPESEALRGTAAGTAGGAAAAGEEEEEERRVAHAEDGLAFLRRLRQARTPLELAQLAGKGRSVGLLRMVRAALRSSQWELIQEACRVLTGCIQQSLGRDRSELAERHETRGGGRLWEE